MRLRDARAGQARLGSLFEDRDEVPPLQFSQHSDDDSGAVAPLVAHDGAGDVGRVEDEFERLEDGFLAEGVVRREELVGADVVPCYVVLF